MVDAFIVLVYNNREALLSVLVKSQDIFKIQSGVTFYNTNHSWQLQFKRKRTKKKQRTETADFYYDIFIKTKSELKQDCQNLTHDKNIAKFFILFNRVTNNKKETELLSPVIHSEEQKLTYVFASTC